MRVCEMQPSKSGVKLTSLDVEWFAQQNAAAHSVSDVSYPVAEPVCPSILV